MLYAEIRALDGVLRKDTTGGGAPSDDDAPLCYANCYAAAAGGVAAHCARGGIAIPALTSAATRLGRRGWDDISSARRIQKPWSDSA
jgi:hypothetical protein